MRNQGSGRPPEAVIIRAFPAAAIICGGLTLLMLVALAAAESAQPTAAGRVESAVLFGLFVAFFGGCLIRVLLVRRQLEVGRDAIVSRPGPRGKPFTLVRGPGDTLRILPKFQLYGKVRGPRLIFLGHGGFVLLTGLRPDKVARACAAQGWRFDGDPAGAARDVQVRLNHGQTIEAVQLLRLFGPFPAAASDGEPTVGLEAAVYEDIGDQLLRSARTSARTAYRQAADRQRAFAGCAPSPGDNAARLAQATRIEAKAAS